MAPKTFDRRGRRSGIGNRSSRRQRCQAAQDDAELPFTIAPLLRSGQKPAAYVRETWSEDATYYTSRNGADRLIVIFSAPRPDGHPISYVLQTLRDDANDIIWLQDPRQLHYTRRYKWSGQFFRDHFAAARRYQQIVTFGVSLGGLPALRAGRLLKATRAISVGGRFPWHPGRLVREERSVQAFDPLCACASPSLTELVVVYSQRNEADRFNAALIVLRLGPP